MEIYKNLKRVIFPNKCLGCEGIIEESVWFCLNCIKEVHSSIYLSKCEICSIPFEYELEQEICINCQIKQPFYDKSLYLYEYNRIIKRIISRIKFSDKTHLIKIIAQILYKSFAQEIKQCDFITFVPMHRKRLNQRYFNQSALIAKYIGKLSDKRILYNLLIRQKFGEAQSRLTRSQRLKNVVNAFTIGDDSGTKNKKIILIDDVYTTGATVNECSKLLRKAGVKEVIVLTFAKTLNH